MLKLAEMDAEVDVVRYRIAATTRKASSAASMSTRDMYFVDINIEFADAYRPFVASRLGALPALQCR